MRLDHFFYYSAHTVSALRSCRERRRDKCVERRSYRLQDISVVARVASYGGPAEALATAGSSLFDIVWDDSDSARSRELRRASHAGLSAEAPQGAKAETPGNQIQTLDRGFRFPVVIGEGSHPFPFRTRKLSSLPPMVLRG